MRTQVNGTQVKLTPVQRLCRLVQEKRLIVPVRRLARRWKPMLQRGGSQTKIPVCS